MSNITKGIIILVALVVIGLSLATGYVIGTNSAYDHSLTINQAWNEILTNYVDRDEIDTKLLSYAAIEGMVEALDDPYSYFFEAEEYEYFTGDIQGEYEGIGAYVNVEDGALILTPIAGSPAEKAGTRAGDILLEVNGEPVENMDYAEVILTVRGPEGTAVELLISREGESQPLVIEVIRETIEIPSVFGESPKSGLFRFDVRFLPRMSIHLGAVLFLDNSVACDMIPVTVRMQDGVGLAQIHIIGCRRGLKVPERTADHEAGVHHDLSVGLQDRHVARARPASEFFSTTPFVEIDTVRDLHQHPPGFRIDWNSPDE